MPVFYRYRAPGGTCLFTAVTHGRQPILATRLGRVCLRQAIEHVRNKRPFEVLAICLLPDHLHTVWTLSEGQADYSTRWQRGRWVACGNPAYLFYLFDGDRDVDFADYGILEANFGQGGRGDGGAEEGDSAFDARPLPKLMDYDEDGDVDLDDLRILQEMMKEQDGP